MPLSKIKIALCLALTGISPLLANADDIDLFQGGESITGNRPNILFIVDNSANWARNDQKWPGGVKQGEAELSALAKVVGEQQQSNIRMGLMMFTEGQSTNGGGYVRFGIRDMNQALTMDASGNPASDSVTNAAKLKTILGGIRPSFNSPTEKVSAAQSNYSNVLYEAYRYFGNKTMYASPYNDKRDYRGNGAYNVSPYKAGNVYANALTGSSATQYQTPLTTDRPCSKNYIIFIGNGFPSKDTDPGSYGDTRVNTLFNKKQIYDSSKTNYADEWARFLRDHGVEAPCTGSGEDRVCADGTVTTYTIDVYNANQDTEQTRLLKSMANAGGGQYFAATSEEEIVTAIHTIINEVQAVDSVFTSASLPVSVNTQGTYLNQIYMGVFRPDGGGRPRWVGNLKQYRFGLRTDADGNEEIYLADSTDDEDGNPTPAINTVTGFIKPSAWSYWSTQNTTNPFWDFKPKGVGGQYDAPDGDLVEKGGAAQRLRELTADPTQVADTRKVFTCTALDGCSSPTLEQFSNSNSNLTSQMGDQGVSVSLTRKGPTVHAQLSEPFGLEPITNEVVTISGASIAAYNGSWMVSPVLTDPLAFTFTIPETPATPATGGITVGSGAPVSKAVNSLIYDNDTQSVHYGQAIATLSSHGYIQNQSITIDGATESAYNGTYRINVLDANTFIYTPNLAISETPAPINSTSPGGNVDCGQGGFYNLAELYRETGEYGSTVVAVTDKASDKKCTVGKSMVISGAPSGYNGGFEIMGRGSECPSLYGKTYNSATTLCFSIAVSATTVEPASPATGTITATGIPTRNVVSMSRTDGNDQNVATVTVKTLQPHQFTAVSQIVIEGADQNEYNGTKTTDVLTDSLSFPDDYTITFKLTTGPNTPPSGAKAIRGYQLSSGLIDWVRGKDNLQDENLDGDLTDVRASIHGDVLHSRPVVINYGGTTGLVAFYGSNDGTLRAVKAGNTSADGTELWSFVSSEHYDTLGRLYNNLPVIKYPDTPDGIQPIPTKRNYFFDGNLGVYQSADLANTYIYAAMRRGGRALYALDVSTPSNPAFLWKRSYRNSGFSELGLTFSEPRVAAIKQDGATSCDLDDPTSYRMVVIFGAGYDPNEEDKPAGQVRSPQLGRGVFVLDAETGNIVKFLAPANSGKKYSFAADVTLMDMDSDTCIDRLYAVDTGGNIHRYDLPNTETTAWNAYHVAKLGDIEDDGGSNDRKFLYPVDAVVGFEGSNRVVYVMGGTGDRETPRDTTIQNHFFMIKDTIPVSDAGGQPTDYPRTLTDLEQVTVFDESSTQVIDPYAADFKGWFLPLSGIGEKTVNAPLTVAGVTYFGTNIPKPASNQCSPNLGEARGYAVNFRNGTAAVGDRDQNGTIDASDLFSNFIGGGLPPSPVSGVVKIGDHEYKRFVIGSGGKGKQSSAIEGHQVEANPNSNRSRVYWYFKKDQ